MVSVVHKIGPSAFICIIYVHIVNSVQFRSANNSVQDIGIVFSSMRIYSEDCLFDRLPFKMFYFIDKLVVVVVVADYYTP